MAKFDYPSRYYADDKDVADLLSQGKFSQKKLLRIAARRGILLSKQLPKESIVEYISQLPFSWVELIALLQSIETEERESFLTNSTLDVDVSLSDLETKAREVRDLRMQLKDEKFNIHTSGDTVFVSVHYQEVNPTSTRMMQWTDQKVEIQLIKKQGEVAFRYAATERGEEIVKSLIRELQPADGKLATLHTITLEGINDSHKRTEFFRSLIYGMDGLRPENVKDLRLNKITVDEAGVTKVETEEISLEGADDVNEATKTEGFSPAAAVRRTILSGDSLLQAPQFHDFCAQGFFISRALWTAIERDGQGRKFEFEAEFKDPEKCKRFSYRPRGFWDRDDDGQLVLKRTEVRLDERRRLSEKLEQAATAAIAQLTEPQDEAFEDQGPQPSNAP